eukprot:2664768-Amphidinium_carterae.1
MISPEPTSRNTWRRMPMPFHHPCQQRTIDPRMRSCVPRNRSRQRDRRLNHPQRRESIAIRETTVNLLLTSGQLTERQKD